MARQAQDLCSAYDKNVPVAAAMSDSPAQLCRQSEPSGTQCLVGHHRAADLQENDVMSTLPKLRWLL